ncbi:MAG: SMC family ATPase [Acidobacteria bacterium]|nr:MAG: SMC family ATPase [Acidobacteriota bacterium]REK04057.1 MAG: SMC family ATPase [Acidobacteriota bacterium]REK15219.1 MAG: SMC family ATPase [Acidobacteriota bacterium]REK46309.1 MAG: SMC family ATPase [Acidobacteriota bacterium]
MYITSIELENIKSHTSSKFEFRKGTTAIIGDNGAGKTTLIEAIAWAMFDLLDYTKDAFLRRGAMRGFVRVTFESAEDERTYVVHRDTATGYYVHDPAINTRVADKKEEVQRFLRKHMKVDPGTDLETLFRSAIGVPQGTFTSVFLETPTGRKRVFDRLLKVDEYRTSSDRLIDTVNYIKGLVSENDNSMSFARGKLEGYDKTKMSFAEAKKNEEEIMSELKTSRERSSKLQKEVEQYEEKEKEILQLKTRSGELNSSLAERKVEIGAKTAEVRASESALEKLQGATKDHSKHLKALGMIKELERERVEREKLTSEISDIDRAVNKVRSEREKNAVELERIAKSRKKIGELEPRIEEQKKLEKQREELRNKIAKAESAAQSLIETRKEIDELRTRYRKVSDETRSAEEARAGADALPALLKEDDELRAKIADLNGKLENDRRFRKEIENGLCPVLSEKCLNLKEGESLEGFLSGQFEKIGQKISEAENRRKTVTAEIVKARKAESAAAGLGTLQKRLDEISRSGKDLAKKKDDLEKLSSQSDSLKKELLGTDSRLEKLDNPEGTVKLLSAELGKEIAVREMVTKIESNLERLESDKRLKTEQLENYKDLDFNWKKYTASRDETIEAHRTFIANEEQAGLLEKRKKALAAVERSATELAVELERVEKKSAALEKGFDREKFARDKAELQELVKKVAALDARIEGTSAEREKLQAHLVELEECRTNLKELENEKKRLDRLASTTAFIRKTLKEAAPRVAQNYVYHVTVEANQLFREITGNADQTLKWDDDYGVSLEEGGFDRPFQNLSGGEQMAAALAIRLALLRQLSDISLAFFDEPTTNLDLERRERLAEQISHITESRSFDQLFVISHDDTFEAFVDNVITVEP